MANCVQQLANFRFQGELHSSRKGINKIWERKRRKKKNKARGDDPAFLQTVRNLISPHLNDSLVTRTLATTWVLYLYHKHVLIDVS